MRFIDDLRRRRAVRGVAQVVVVLALLIAAWSYQSESTTTEKTSAVVETLLVDACDTSDSRSLRQADLDGACELARQGDIEDAIEQMDVDDPDAVRDALAAVEPPVPPVPSTTPVEDALTMDLTSPSCQGPGFPLVGATPGR